MTDVERSGRILGVPVGVAFTLEVPAIDFRERAINNLSCELVRLESDRSFDHWAVEELAAFLLEPWTVEPIEWDEPLNGELLADEQRGDTRVLGMRLRLTRGVEQALRVRPENGFVTRYPQVGSASRFDYRTGNLRLEGTVSDLAGLRDTARQLVGLINADIDRHFRDLGAVATDMVRAKRAEVSRRVQAEDQLAAQLGVEVVRQTDAVLPVNVSERREVQVAREVIRGRAKPGDPYLTPDSARRIVELIHQAGRGFEIAPLEFAKMREEGLRYVIACQLNAVFHRHAVSGETFTKDGKPDLVITDGGGPVLVGECKFWGGEALYIRTIEDQLFRYVQWRHTVGVLITFNKNSDMTATIRKAQSAAWGHESIISTPPSAEALKDARTYFVTRHRHPDDPDKVLEVHHLLFNLHVHEAGRSGKA